MQKLNTHKIRLFYVEVLKVVRKYMVEPWNSCEKGPVKEYRICILIDFNCTPILSVYSLLERYNLHYGLQLL